MLTNGSLIFVNGAPAIFHRHKPGGRADVLLNGLLREVDLAQITQERETQLPSGSDSQTVLAVLAVMAAVVLAIAALTLLWEGLSR